VPNPRPPPSPLPDAYSDDITETLCALKPGDRLDNRYDVLEHIGSGGMADVFRGWDDMLCRDVAIKVLKPARISESMKKRVLREARATCAVDHPHMLRVTDMGFVGEAPYLVTDLLRGTSLAEVLRRAQGGRLDWRYAITLLLPAMDALHAAHEACLVHRDIKPENLFLHHRGKEEVLVVLDLGIVKFTESDGSPGPRWTQTGMILGTALYASPEQASSAPVDRRSDVYSMGVTLYRLLTGQHLFPPEPDDGPVSALTRHIFEPPPRLSDRAFPPALVEAVYTSLAKDPAKRHDSMEVFAEALRACLDEVPRASRTAHPAGRGWSSMQRVSHLGLGATLAPVIQQAVAPDAAAVLADPPAPVLCARDVPSAVDEAWDLCLPQDPDATTPEEYSCESGLVEDGQERPTPDLRARGRRSPAAVAMASVVRPIDPLDRASEDVRRCVRDHGDRDTRTLTVHVAVHADGGIGSVRIRGDADESFLAICVRDRLVRLRFDPGAPRALEHTYQFNPGGMP
jgi:hypothetical protein